MKIRDMIQAAYAEWEDGWNWTMQVYDDDSRISPVYADCVDDLGTPDEFAAKCGITLNEAQEIIDEWATYDSNIRETAARARDAALDALKTGDTYDLDSAVRDLAWYGDALMFQDVFDRIDELAEWLHERG